MELILKLHALVDSDFRELQDKYEDTNIGFERLADLSEYGINAEDHETNIDEGFAEIETEVQKGNFPILSVFSDPVGWHIWVAVRDGESFRLISRAYGYNNVLEMNDLNVVRQNLNQYRGGTIHFVTYDLSEANGT